MNESGLIEAVKRGDYAAVEMCVNSGANINQQGEQGWTALNFAAGKGDLALVRLLVERGADPFMVGSDKRTPYMIAVAAGRMSVAKYLSEIQDKYAQKKNVEQTRRYCMACYLRDLRQYPAWEERRINWKYKAENDNDVGEENFLDDKIVFIHQDFSVTESIWHNENIIFNNVDSAWERFCTDFLKFKVPNDIDLIGPNDGDL
jgi:uncharacterized protein